jgi:hypothetical protein
VQISGNNKIQVENFFQVEIIITKFFRRWHALVKRTLVHWASINDRFDKFSQFWRGITAESITTDHNLEQVILVEGSAKSNFARIFGMPKTLPEIFIKVIF